MKKSLFKKSISVLLSVLMLMSCWVFVPGEHNHASAALADISSLDEAIAAYEAKMDGTIYKNMQQAYYDYITALEVRDAYKYGGEAADTTTPTLAQAEANLEASTANMTVWNPSDNYAKMTPSFDGNSGSHTLETYGNIVFTRQTRTADTNTYENASVTHRLYLAPTVLVVDGINEARMPIMYSGKKTNTNNTRYTYAVYPTAGNNNGNDHGVLDLIGYWHGNRGDTLDFTWSWSYTTYQMSYSYATGYNGISANTTSHRSDSLTKTGLTGSKDKNRDFHANVIKIDQTALGDTKYVVYPNGSTYFYYSSGNDANSDQYWGGIPQSIGVINYKYYVDQIDTTKLANAENVTVDSVDYWTYLGVIDKFTSFTFSHNSSGKTAASSDYDTLVNSYLTTGYNYASSTAADSTLNSEAVAAVSSDLDLFATKINSCENAISTDSAPTGYANLRSEITTSEAFYTADHAKYTDASWNTFVNAYNDARSFMANTEAKYYAEASTANAKYTALKAAREALTLKTFDVTFDNLINFSKWNTTTASNGVISNVTNGEFTLTSNDGTAEGTSTSPLFPVEAGKKYKVNIDFEGNGWDVYIFFYDANTTSGLGIDFVDGSDRRFSSSGVGPEEYATFTAPTGAVQAVIRVDANSNGNKTDGYTSNTVKFSNIRVYDAGKVADGVSYENAKTYTYGDTYGTLPTPTRTGYTFTGWVDANGNVVSSTATIDASKALYSTWTISKYTVTFEKADSTTTSAQYDYGTAATSVMKPANTAANYDDANHYAYTWPTISAVTADATYKEIKTPTAHTLSSEITTSATCTAEGMRTYTCSGCAYSYTEAISATGHTEVTVTGTAATCTDTGLTDGKKCSVCGATTVAHQTIAALGHLDTNKDHVCDRGCGVAQGTCSDSATDSDHLCDYGCGKVLEACSDKSDDGDHKCDICGDDNITAHTKGSETKENVTDATCESAGKYDAVYYCTECNTVMERTNDITIAQLPHDWQSTTYSWTTDGKSCTATRTCANNAEHKESETVNTTGAQKVAPTCEDKGSTLYTAKFTVAWATEQENEVYDIPANNHTPAEAVIENNVPATCTTDGSYDTVVYCSVEGCKKELSRVNTVVPQKGHTAGDEANCTTAQTCTICGAVLVEALKHNYASVVTDPTCTADGFTTYTCTRCGDTYSDNVVDALGHTWTAANCTTPKTCSVCDATEGEALGHTWVAANCTTPKTCSVCDATEGEALGHTWVAANCTTPKTCSVCDATEGEALGHIWVAANCTTPKTCSVCDATEGEMLGHSYESVVTKPICTAGGYTTHSCSRCDDSYVDSYTDALDHSWSDTYTMESDGKDGKHYQICTRENCSAKNTPVAHTWSNGVENPEADCENAGTMNYTCTADGCGAAYTESVNPDGHSFSSWVDEVPAICNKTGTKGHYECTVCHKYFDADKTTVIDDITIEIASDNHNWVKGETVKPTCTSQGYTNYKCSYCDSEMSSDFVKENGHTASAAVIENETEGTCISEKTWNEVVYCSVCDEKLSTEAKIGSVDENNHRNKTEYEKVGETCLTVGYTAGTFCEDCDKWISGHDEISAIAHKNKAYHQKVDATCVATGTIEYWSCPDCSKNFSDEECNIEITDLTIAIIPDNHELKTTEKKAPTCNEIGWDEYVSCQREGCGYTTYVEKEKLGHAYGEWTFIADGQHKRVCANDNSHTETEACADVSTDNDCLCDKCNELVAHSYSDASCDLPATCTVCGASTGDKLGHDYTVFVETVDYTCTTDGYTVYRCSRCDATEKRDITDAAHKAESDYTVIKKATCEADGYKAILCSECDTEILTKTIEKRAHNIVDTTPALEPTCSETGIMNQKCDNAENAEYEACAYTSTRVTDKVATAHKWETEYTVDVKADCENSGSKSYHCEYCDAINADSKVTINAREHILVYKAGDGIKHEIICQYDDCSYAVTESCSGGTAYCNALAICENCNTGWGEVDADNHISEEVDIRNAKPATCSEVGYTGDTYHSCCSTLKVKGSDIPKLAHTEEVVNGYAATCTADGLTNGVKCSVCDEIFTAQEVIPATGHKYTSEVVIEPSCKSQGIVTYICENDSKHTYNDIIPATGHKDDNKDGKCDVCGIDSCEHTETVTIKANPASCEFDGYSGDTVCARCGYLIAEGSVVPAMDHDWGATPVEVIPANCTTATTMIYKCRRCSETQKRYEGSADKSVHTIIVLEHLEPTCDEAGHICYVCMLCDGYIKYEKLAAKGHIDENDDGICDTASCGAPLTPEAASRCSCMCHDDSVIMQFIYKIVKFFWKLFGMNQSCECGNVHY